MTPEEGTEKEISQYVDCADGWTAWVKCVYNTKTREVLHEEVIFSDRDSKFDYQIVELCVGSNRYFVHGTSSKGVREVATHLKIPYTSISPSKLGSGGGIFKIWNIGELADYLKKKKKEATKT